MTINLALFVDLNSDDFLNWLIDGSRKIGDTRNVADKNGTSPTAACGLTKSKLIGSYQTDIFTSEDREYGIYAKAVFVSSQIFNVPIKNTVSIKVCSNLYINEDLVPDQSLRAQIIVAFDKFAVGDSIDSEVARGSAAGLTDQMYSILFSYSATILALSTEPTVTPLDTLNDLKSGKLGGCIGGSIDGDDCDTNWPAISDRDKIIVRLMNKRKRARFVPRHYDSSRQIDRSDETDPRRDMAPSQIVDAVAKESAKEMNCDMINSKGFKVGNVLEYPEFKTEIRYRDEKVGCVVITIPELVIRERKTRIAAYAYLYYPADLDDYAVDQMMECIKVAALSFVIMLYFANMQAAVAALKVGFWVCVNIKAVEGIDDAKRCISPDAVTVSETSEWGPLTIF